MNNSRINFTSEKNFGILFSWDQLMNENLSRNYFTYESNSRINLVSQKASDTIFIPDTNIYMDDQISRRCCWT